MFGFATYDGGEGSTNVNGYIDFECADSLGKWQLGEINQVGETFMKLNGFETEDQFKLGQCGDHRFLVDSTDLKPTAKTEFCMPWSATDMGNQIISTYERVDWSYYAETNICFNPEGTNNKLGLDFCISNLNRKVYCVSDMGMTADPGYDTVRPLIL